MTVDIREEGDERTETLFEGTADGSTGRETITMTHRSGLEMERRITDVESGIITRHEKNITHDDRFRPLLTSDELVGKLSVKGYDCCDLERETSVDGCH